MRTSPRTRVATTGLGLIVSAALLAGCAVDATPAAESGGLEGQIVWADYGGPTNEARYAAYFDDFADETGVEVVPVTISDAMLYALLDGERGEYDAFQVGIRDVLTYSENLAEIPEAARGDLIPEEARPYMLGAFFLGTAQGWLTETFPDGGPQDWADFFDVEAFPGKRAWPGSPGAFDGSFEIALLADGVAPEDLYPLDLDRATAKLDSIRDHLVFYQSYPEIQQLLSSGSAAIGVGVTGQFSSLKKAGLDVTVQWNEAFQTINGFAVTDAASNPVAVAALAEHLNDPAGQAAFTEATLYGPVNSAVFDELPAEVLDDVVNAPSHDNLILWDEKWRGSNRDLLISTYTAWLAG